MFDGTCQICNGTVRWLTAHDPGSRFEYIALQSEERAAALHAAGHTAELPDSLVVIDGRGVHLYSSATLAIARQLPFPWSLGRVLAIVPRPLRDALYRWVAANRHRLHGVVDRAGTRGPND